MTLSSFCNSLHVDADVRTHARKHKRTQTYIHAHTYAHTHSNTRKHTHTLKHAHQQFIQ